MNFRILTTGISLALLAACAPPPVEPICDRDVTTDKYGNFAVTPCDAGQAPKAPSFLGFFSGPGLLLSDTEARDRRNRREDNRVLGDQGFLSAGGSSIGAPGSGLTQGNPPVTPGGTPDHTPPTDGGTPSTGGNPDVTPPTGGTPDQTPPTDSGTPSTGGNPDVTPPTGGTPDHTPPTDGGTPSTGGNPGVTPPTGGTPDQTPPTDGGTPSTGGNPDVTPPTDGNPDGTPTAGGNPDVTPKPSVRTELHHALRSTKRERRRVAGIERSLREEVGVLNSSDDRNTPEVRAERDRLYTEIRSVTVERKRLQSQEAERDAALNDYDAARD